jgi:hypothetical protein
MAGPGFAFEVRPRILTDYAEVLHAGAVDLAAVGGSVAGARVEAGWFGELPEAGVLADRCCAGREADAAEIAELGGWLAEAASGLAESAGRYSGADRVVAGVVGAAEAARWATALPGAAVPPSEPSGVPLGVGYEWATQQPPSLEMNLTPVHRPAPRGLEGVLTSGVDWVLREAGLIAVLERVTGDAEALHGAAVARLEQAEAVRGLSARLRRGGVAVAGSWGGEASQAFAAAMGARVAALDQLACGMAADAHVLNQAGVVAGAAQDAGTGIVTDAAAWAAAEAAATVAADALTFGLATVGGALAESATLAGFVARAERISAELGGVLEQLAGELAALRAARDAIGAARGLDTLRAIRQARGTVNGLRGAGGVLHAMERGVGSALRHSGLPVGPDGPTRLRSLVRRTLSDEVKQVWDGRLGRR